MSNSSRPHGLQHTRPPCPQHLLKFAQVHVHCISEANQPSHPPLPSSRSAFNLSQHWNLFKWISSLHQVAKVRNFSFSISPSKGYSGLISFEIDWFDLLTVQGTLKSLLQHHSWKASILRHLPWGTVLSKWEKLWSSVNASFLFLLVMTYWLYR